MARLSSKSVSDALVSLWAGRSQATICTVLFVLCSLVYFLNERTISSNDNVPNAILALNWLENGVLHFDALRNSYFYENGGETIPYFFVEAPNGHLTSTYPIGTAIVTFPLYLAAWLIMKGVEAGSALLGSPIETFNVIEESARAGIYNMQKLVSIFVASLSVVLFYLATRLKFSPGVSLLSAFIFAFCTNTWMTGSQGLWQHGTSNLVVLAIILSLLKANVVGTGRRRRLLVVVGVLCGLLPGIRPTSMVYGLAAIAYCLYAFRWEALYLLLGLPSLLISASWNFYFFGFDLKYLFVGGYSRFANQGDSFTQQYYALTWQQFRTAFLGHLVSPNRGLLVFSPIVLLSVPGAWVLAQRRSRRDETLLLFMLAAALLLFIQYCFFTVWAGGWCYGPRYMTDLLPVIGLLIPYALDYTLAHWDQWAEWVGRSLSITLILLMVLSVFPQVVGAFGSNNWDGIPNSQPQRIWQWRDTQVGRHARHVYYEMIDAIPSHTNYLRGFEGTVRSVDQVGSRVVGDRVVALSNQQVPMTITVQNTGEVPWFGYETGLGWGMAIATVEFARPNTPDQPIREPQLLYVSGNPERGDIAQAVGDIRFPRNTGAYEMSITLSVNAAREMPTPSPVYTIRTVVREREG
ncbi:MAG: hypothetical protein KME20_24105 [Kaiparowitsia implicata GSE-PSE-MK54-09C]|jgi:hypothetical protein|nr:hypothetical protein [Kaiparowitsia implicata GSE-PSE-MK54-09C]